MTGWGEQYNWGRVGIETFWGVAVRQSSGGSAFSGASGSSVLWLDLPRLLNKSPLPTNLRRVLSKNHNGRNATASTDIAKKMQAMRIHAIVAPNNFQVIFLFRAGQSIESIKIVTTEETIPC